MRKVVFGDVDVHSEFFDSFREDHGGAAFDKWFNRKADEPAYVCYEGQTLVAFLYLKVEGPEENYSDIEPRFKPKRRLKIGTFKVELNGYRLGERFLKIVFDNAVPQRVKEIYVTIFPRAVEQQRLIKIFEEFGFKNHGTKINAYGTEDVYLRDMTPRFDAQDPKLTFPYVSRSSRAFIVPIRLVEYHTSLLPDSIPQDRVGRRFHRTRAPSQWDPESLRKPIRVQNPPTGRHDHLLSNRRLPQECRHHAGHR